ncbi:MAG TPA: T9SS type A sorting domain-containing protein [Ignavibacteriaceae bacterium]|nr:T9SS type A sorting domain-containing protein [Ignavibacteriaceae bacterium]
MPFVNKFSLSQNYPNPFNPTTSLQYAIGSRQFVTLKVYDLLGREVATLVNEEKSAGEYEVEFNAATLPSGIYFYQLKAGQYSETKKMILLK